MRLTRWLIPPVGVLTLAAGPARAHEVTPACEGTVPEDRECTITFVAEHDVIGVDVEIGFWAGYLRGTISDGHSSITVTCASQVVGESCDFSSRGDNFRAGSTITIDVFAVGALGTGRWELSGIYDHPPPR